mmetsp:Transcript_6215/g.12614  ORF Transcript_6215/g.12614 Transcript_6215/m.12614 type:complete len:231 (-) Transcript_6215:490-1182(-)
MVSTRALKKKGVAMVTPFPASINTMERTTRHRMALAWFRSWSNFSVVAASVVVVVVVVVALPLSILASHHCRRSNSSHPRWFPFPLHYHDYHQCLPLPLPLPRAPYLSLPLLPRLFLLHLPLVPFPRLSHHPPSRPPLRFRNFPQRRLPLRRHPIRPAERESIRIPRKGNWNCNSHLLLLLLLRKKTTRTKEASTARRSHPRRWHPASVLPSSPWRPPTEEASAVRTWEL